VECESSGSVCLKGIQLVMAGGCRTAWQGSATRWRELRGGEWEVGVCGLKLLLWDGELMSFGSVQSLPSCYRCGRRPCPSSFSLQ